MEVFLRGDFKVSHYPTSFAHKMIVIACCRVITMKPLAKIEFLYLSLSCKDVEVAIDCAKRDMGYLRSYLLMHPFSRWVSDGLLKDLINLFALSASFRPDGLHGITS